MFWHQKNLVVYSFLTSSVFPYKNVVSIILTNMQIFSFYLIISLVLAIANSEMNKIPSYDDISTSNPERIVYIFL